MEDDETLSTLSRLDSVKENGSVNESEAGDNRPSQVNRSSPPPDNAGSGSSVTDGIEDTDQTAVPTAADRYVDPKHEAMKDAGMSDPPRSLHTGNSLPSHAYQPPLPVNEPSIPDDATSGDSASQIAAGEEDLPKKLQSLSLLGINKKGERDQSSELPSNGAADPPEAAVNARMHFNVPDQHAEAFGAEAELDKPEPLVSHEREPQQPPGSGDDNIAAIKAMVEKQRQRPRKRFGKKPQSPVNVQDSTSRGNDSNRDYNKNIPENEESHKVQALTLTSMDGVERVKQPGDGHNSLPNLGRPAQRSPSQSSGEGEPLSSSRLGAVGGAPKATPNQPSSGVLRLWENKRNQSMPMQQHRVMTSAGGRQDIQFLLRKFQLLLQNNKLDEAMELFYQAANKPNLSLQEARTVGQVCGQLGKLFLGKSSEYAAREVLKKGVELFQRLGAISEDDLSLLWQMYDDLATAHSSLGEHEEEAINYERAIELHSQLTIPTERWPHMMNNVGNCYKRLGNYNLARQHLENAKEKMLLIYFTEPNEAHPSELRKTLASLADLYRDMGEVGLAIAEYENILQGFKNQVAATMEDSMRLMTARQALAELYEQNGQLDAARKMRDSVNDIPSIEDEGSTDDGQFGNDFSSKANNLVKQERLIQEGIQAQQSGNHKRAAECYEMALAGIQAHDPLKGSMGNKEDVLAKVHNNLGTAYQEMRNFPEGLKHLNESLKLRQLEYGVQGISPFLAQAHFNLGNTYLKRRNEEDLPLAVNHYGEALRIYSTLGHTHQCGRTNKMLGDVYNEMEDMTIQAVEHFKKSRQLFEQTQTSLEELQSLANNLGGCYTRLGEHEKAVTELRRALELVKQMQQERPNDDQFVNDEAASWNNLGTALQSQGKFVEAHEAFEKCLQIRQMLIDNYGSLKALTDLPSTLHNIGTAYLEQDRYPEAIGMFEKAIEAFQKVGLSAEKSRLMMSRCYENMGEGDKALEVLDS